ncbi:MAG: endolytic transglycosylase MltG [candidate division Zixibacteria bacterium]|nr:endolytic transglycosylase MltG [candidate division Zixibacteria bacterium]
MIKLLSKIAAITALVILVIGGVSAWWLFSGTTIPPTSVIVDTGDTFTKVVDKLRDKGLVGFPWLFTKVGTMAELDTRIIPGRYDFSGQVSNYGILNKLWRGDIVIATVTVPEGYNLRQIAKLLYDKCGVDQKIFDSLTQDRQFLSSLGVGAGFAEGYLYPETYLLRWGLPATEAISVMVRQLNDRLTPPLLARADSLGYNKHNLLTMASIIQREGKEPDEFPRIASVYQNRYKIGMRLQADPTVIYGMGGLSRKLLYRDYKFPSPYNTYLHPGLPPTPICSPGMTAIMAALYPERTKYLYFVADGSGRHVFNSTFDDHKRDIRSIKKRVNARNEAGS